MAYKAQFVLERRQLRVVVGLLNVICLLIQMSCVEYLAIRFFVCISVRENGHYAKSQ